MADMYGPSEAELAGKAAAQFGVSSAAGLAALNDSIKKITAEINAGIQVGLTPQQIEDKQAELEGLRNEAQALTTNIGAQYGYVGKEAETTAAETARQLAATQAQQAQIGAATLGRLAGLPAGFKQSAAQRDALRAGLGTEAAVQAYLGGTPSVEAGMLPRVQGLGESTGATLGLAGITAGGSNMFSRALTALEAKTQADLARDKMLMGAQIESTYRKEARDREARQREQAQSQIAQLTQTFLNQQTQNAQTLAQLQAAAAGADTRTGKQKAQAELQKFKDQQAIQHGYTMREIAARAQQAGLSGEETQAILRNANYNAGTQTMLADRLNKAQSLISTLPTDITKLGGKAGWLYDGAGGVIFVQPLAGGKVEQTPVNTQALVDKLIEAAGTMRGFTDPKQRSTAFRQGYWNDDRVISQAEKKLLTRLFGKAAADPDFYVKLATAPGLATLPAGTTTTRPNK